MTEDSVKDIIETLDDLKDDSTLPRNIKMKIEKIENILKVKSDDVSMRVNKALNELDEMSDDNNIQPYTRTQIWNIVSMLESI